MNLQQRPDDTNNRGRKQKEPGSKEQVEARQRSAMFYSPAMNHGTACGGSGADQRGKTFTTPRSFQHNATVEFSRIIDEKLKLGS
ncbi:hypothetical protein F2P81_015490 [Scophthalmus maximus]|uniref:Uncharacterized protein n=1 Tax=Scophthalmus maximus TaxID=52904 RepID=A0A6A4SMP5_SCOMX|nr:hypothetical protein F2P81_015490 [Scophthalmus maximus]